MNRKEMQEWLDQFPEDTEIEVVVAEDGPAWAGTMTREEEFDGIACDYVDTTTMPTIPEDRRRRVLTLGERE